MIKINRKAIALAALLVAAPCSAFPVVEGASVIGSLVGVVCSLLVGLIPSSSKGVKFLTGLVTMLLVSMVYIGVDTYNKVESAAVDEFAHLSRPILPTPAEAIVRSSQPILPYNHDEIVFEKNNPQLNISLSEFQSSTKYEQLKPVFLDYVQGGFNNKPEQFAENISVLNVGDIAQLAQKENGRIILFSSQTDYLKHASYEIYKRTGHRIFKVSLPEFGFDHEEELAKLSEQDELWVEDYDNVHSLNLIDIRSSIEELNTLENAINVSLLDFYVMSDKQVVEYLQSIEDPVFLAYHPQTYVLIHDRLKDLNVKYRLLKGGLDELYEQKYTVTPLYLNISRELQPLSVMRDYSESKDLRFICIEKQHCMNNLPDRDTYYFSMRQDGRESIKKAIEELPKEYRYVTVSTNLETYGNSVLAGYWLNQSGHTYLGMFSHSDRFSLDFIHIDFMEKRNLLLSDYQDEFAWKQEAIASAKEFVHNSGLHWAILFFLAGTVFRFALMPCQALISKSYYFKHSSGKTAAASIFLLAALVFAYNTINGLILNHGIVNHGLITNFDSSLKLLACAAFAAMIIFQLMISFPKGSKLRLGMVGLIVAVYAAGLINHIVAPLVFFLIGSELVAILMQLPYFAQSKAFERLNGIYFSSFRDISDEQPEKWRLVNKVVDTEGFLVSSEASRSDIEQAIAITFREIDGGMYLVRSCASDAKESLLGGYHESLKVPYPELMNTIQAMLGSELDYVWVQPYYETEYNGILTSISDDGLGVHLVIGKGDNATEGGKGCVEHVLSRTQQQSAFSSEIELLKRVERFYKAPVQIEFGKAENGDAILYQVRILNTDKYEIAKLYLGGKEAYALNESFLVRSSRLTGSILEKASKGKIKHVAGFNYVNVNSGYEKLYVTKGAFTHMEKRLERLHEQVMLSHSPIAIYELINELCDCYTRLYERTQSKYGFKSVQSTIDYESLGALDGSDLEIGSSRKCIGKAPHTLSPVKIERREAQHNLIVWINYLLHILLDRYSKTLGVGNYTCYSLEQLMSIGVDNPRSPLPYAEQSVFEESANKNKVIVQGDIDGKVISVKSFGEHNFKLPDNGDWVLAGEEIPSGLVKYLHLFKGVYSVYGHSSSHLAISARELNIPYQTISKAKLDEYLA